MAIAETAARKLLHGGGNIAQGVTDVGGISFGLWDLATGFLANILANLFAALAGLAHLLVLPLELLWQWLVTAAAAISSGIDGLWHHVTGFFAGIWTSIAATAHQFVLPLETLWQWLCASTADAAGAISSGLDGLWQLATGFLPEIFAQISAAAARVAHELPEKLDELWRWLKAAAAVALPYVLAVAAVLLLVAFVWFCGSALCKVAVGACKTLVYALSYLGHGLCHVAVAVGGALSCLLPPGAQCLHFCAVVSMKAPGAAGSVISRAAFVADPALYFQILHTAGSVVATAVFYTATGASFVAAPVAALFRVSVGA